MTEYRDNLDETTGDLFTVKEFLECCKSGLFIDYDGYGNPIKNKKINNNFIVLPSELEKIPKDATHILWYNK
jgi:hypothetical protein